MKKLNKKAAEALKESPIELTQDDLKELQIIGAFRRNKKVCCAAKAEFPLFIWKEDGTKDKCNPGDYIVLDELGELKLVPQDKFAEDYEPLRVPSFYDSAIFYPAPQPDPVEPPAEDPVVDNPPA